jgi:protoporphyrinogen oxidase
MAAAYRLAKAGVTVTLFEASDDLGGLVGSFDFRGRPVDRFYHVILPTDDRVIGLADELGVGDRFRFRPTKVGFYDDGRLFSMTSLREFATFPLLAPHDRLRLAGFVARCQLPGGHDRLDDVPLLEWLGRLCGRRTLERLWKPLLDSKFDGRYDDLPATYIWARTRRMSNVRDSGGRELMGWLEGGYQTLIDALEARIRALGGTIHRSTRITRIAVDAERAGVGVGDRMGWYDAVLCTLVPRQAEQLFEPELRLRLPVDRFRYLGVVCLLLRLTRSVSPYYHLNITDRRVPLTTIVETTHVVDPQAVGGSLLYASKYVDPMHEDLERPLDLVESDYLRYVHRVFPELKPEHVLASVVQRARVVEPVHTLGGAKNVPDMFPLPRLTFASTAHVYPDIVSGQAVTGVAERAVAGVLERLEPRRRLAA